MEDLVFLNGKPVENPHESHHHVSPVWMYVAVFLALVVLTVVTYAVSYANLGPMSLMVAMVVATIKASLVIAFFMHLLFEDRMYFFLFATALIAIGIFFGFIMFDMSAAADLNDEGRLGTPRIEADIAAGEKGNEPVPPPPLAREHVFQ